MVNVKPLYQGYEQEDATRGLNNIYLDTQVVNYLRKNTHPQSEEFKNILFNPSFKNNLYYSSAHLGDYLKDPSDHKNYDLDYMGKINMVNFLSYDPHKRRCFLQRRHPREVFYNGRIDRQQIAQNYQSISKPKIDSTLMKMYEWFKETLYKYEKDVNYINEIDERDAKTFLSLKDQVKLNSETITPALFLENSEKYWRDNVYTLNNKDASKFFLESSLTDYDTMNYKNEKFNLNEPNLIEQIQSSEFKRNIQDYIEHIMYDSGLNFNENYDELTLFRMSFGCFQILGIEPDKVKNFNIRSMTEDAAHFYFASTCNYLITEDNGFYRKAKVLYGVLGITTKVFRMEEFIKYISLTA